MGLIVSCLWNVEEGIEQVKEVVVVEPSDLVKTQRFHIREMVEMAQVVPTETTWLLERQMVERQQALIRELQEEHDRLAQQLADIIRGAELQFDLEMLSKTCKNFNNTILYMLNLFNLTSQTYDSS
jgi:hypothetical protein